MIELGGLKTSVIVNEKEGFQAFISSVFRASRFCQTLGASKNVMFHIPGVVISNECSC